MTTETYPGIPTFTVAGNGPYAIAHEYVDAADLVVKVKDDEGTVVTLVSGDDYSIDPLSDADSGTLTLLAAAATAHDGKALVILRETSLEQGFEGASPREKGVERSLDRVIQAGQDQQRRADQAIVLPELDTGGRELPVDRAGKYLAFDGDKNPVALPGTNETSDAALKSQTQTISGLWTWENDAPALVFADEDGVTSRKKTRILYDADVLRFQTLTGSDVLVSTDYQQTKDATGAIQHDWSIAGAIQLTLDATGLKYAGGQLRPEASVAEYRAGTADKAITVKTAYDAQAVVALADGANIALDLGAGFNFSVTLGGNRVLDNPTNVKVGQAGFIRVTQDGAGSRTLAFGSNYRFSAGAAPSLTSAAGAYEVLRYQVLSATEIEIITSYDVKAAA